MGGLERGDGDASCRDFPLQAFYYLTEKTGFLFLRISLYLAYPGLYTRLSLSPILKKQKKFNSYKKIKKCDE
jgi:hypothetical protein